MQSSRYSLPARILHWTVGVLVFGQIVLGFFTDASERAQADRLRLIHAEIGILLIGLMLLRISWRIAVPPPPLTDKVAQGHKFLALWTHRLIYILLFAMLGSGIAVWMWIGTTLDMFGLFVISLPQLPQDDEFWLSVAGYCHEFGALVLSALIFLHISAAFWHEWILGDRLIRDRML